MFHVLQIVFQIVGIFEKLHYEPFDHQGAFIYLPKDTISMQRKQFDYKISDLGAKTYYKAIWFDH